MDDEDSWDQHNVASLASNPIPPRKQQQRLSLGPAAKEEEDLFHLPGHLAEAAKKGSVALLAAAAAEVDHDDDDDDDDGMTTIGLTPSALPVPLTPKHRVHKLLSETERSAAATHKVDKDVDADEVDVDATIAITVAKAVAEEARKGKEAQTRALAAQGAQAARLHKEKLQEALQAQHAALYEQMLQGTLPPPRQATWSEALTDVLPGAKSLFDIFGAETHSQAGSQFRSQARSHRVNEAAAVVPAASAQWQQEKAALEARLRLAEERAKVAEAKAESSALALIEARGRQTVAASRASVAQLALNTALIEAQGGANGDMEEKTMKAAGLSPPAGIKHLVGVDVGVAVLLPGMRTQLDEAPVMAPVAMLASGSTTDETTDELAGEGRELTMDRNLAAARSIADIDW
eukprot:jgi/Chrpa1/11714/Chrysochromulina_OHIO_Genome00018085-RA